jgi:hypothetical protein
VSDLGRSTPNSKPSRSCGPKAVSRRVVKLYIARLCIYLHISSNALCMSIHSVGYYSFHAMSRPISLRVRDRAPAWNRCATFAWRETLAYTDEIALASCGLRYPSKCMLGTLCREMDRPNDFVVRVEAEVARRVQSALRDILSLNAKLTNPIQMLREILVVEKLVLGLCDGTSEQALKDGDYWNTNATSLLRCQATKTIPMSGLVSAL